MRKRLIIIGLNTFCLIAVLVCQGVSAAIARPLYVGQAAKTWAGQSGERFAQLAVHFPPSYTFNEETIYNVHNSLDTSLLAVSLESRDERRLYTDAWSAQGTASVTGQRGSAGAAVIGVGGDFFLFHPLRLRDGSYIYPDDLMDDLIILDEDLAWRLYGSVNLTGLEVFINGKLFVIAGVAARESGFAYSHALGADNSFSESSGLYMSYNALRDMTGGQARVDSYEIVMPDLVTDFAIDALGTAFNDSSLVIVDNTDRFSYSNLFRIIGSFGERSLSTSTIAFPYWENAVRFAEDWLALLLFISLIMLICPVYFTVFYGVKLIRFGFRKLKTAVRALLKKREDRIYMRYLQQQNISVNK